MDLIFIVSERTETTDDGLKLMLRPEGAADVRYAAHMYLTGKLHAGVNDLHVGQRLRLTIADAPQLPVGVESLRDRDVRDALADSMTASEVRG